MISQLIKNIVSIDRDVYLGELLITNEENLENINILNESNRKFNCNKNLNELFQEKVTVILTY